MIFDSYVGSKHDIEKVKVLIHSGPAVDWVKTFSSTDQLLEYLKRDTHYLNMAVICGHYNSVEQKYLRQAIRKYEPKATVLFYDPSQ